MLLKDYSTISGPSVCVYYRLVQLVLVSKVKLQKNYVPNVYPKKKDQISREKDEYSYINLNK